ncbi:MAG: hypothetical protein R3B13_37930 [Polyangiaceae bacterium]
MQRLNSSVLSVLISAAGKPASEQLVVTGSTITSSNYAFLAHSTGAWSVAAPLSAGDNTYVSASPPHDWIFAYDDQPVSFEQWKTSTKTDSTSTTSP